ncbi:hypothetical protein JOD18_004174 [Gracilibacillus alcaliphilus]|nr:hypothetical protein [Gracilibacillus alcaliphilus]
MEELPCHKLENLGLDYTLEGVEPPQCNWMKVVSEEKWS